MFLTEDWETTCAIYPDSKISTILDNAGNLLRATIQLKFAHLDQTVFCRRPESEIYRFWTLHDGTEFVFQATFWGEPALKTSCNEEKEDNCYSRVEIKFQSQYPHTFPQDGTERKWLQWIEKEANKVLQDDQISYAVCDFIEHRTFEFFNIILADEEHILIQFENNNGPTFYDIPSLLVDPRRAFTLHRVNTNNFRERITTEDLTPHETKRIVPVFRKWEHWLPVECPICFDTITMQQAATITCGHMFCKPCISMYLKLKAEEIFFHRDNPFLCPVTKCRRGMLIVGCVKQFLPPQNMEKVREWYKDRKNPPCYTLPSCLKRDCSGVMRKTAVDGFMIYCERCGTKWCELCLKRVRNNTHEEEDCEYDVCIQFCERYLAANDEIKLKCEEKFPFIKLYAKSRVHDLTILEWIQSMGQVCPGCKTGMERSEGCFHMKCYNCETHFCYECGEVLHPPYYGTHHCWEAQNNLTLY